MNIDALSTALLALTGPLAALALVGLLYRSRPFGRRSLWLGLWLLGLSLRFGKSTLHALFGLPSWALNVGLAGMAAAPVALFLSIRPAAQGQEVRGRDLLHFAPALLLAIGAPWIPNERGDPISIAIYCALLGLWAVYLAAGWRVLMRRKEQEAAERRLQLVALASTTLMGLMFASIFFWTPSLYLLNSVLFSASVIAVGVLLIGLGSVDRKRAGVNRVASPAQVELVARVQAALADPAVSNDLTLNLARMARRLGVSQKTLSDAINRATGESFTTLLNGVRVREAQHLLLTTSDPIEDIAGRCGFASAAAFHRTFRRHMDTTPAAWRARSGSEN